MMRAKKRGELDCQTFLSNKWIFFLLSSCIFTGMLFISRMWMADEAKVALETSNQRDKLSNLKSLVLKQENIDSGKEWKEFEGKQNAIQLLDRTILDLETKLVAAKVELASMAKGSLLSISGDLKVVESAARRKYFMVIGIFTGFSNQERRNTVRATWMPQGEKLKKLEEERGIVIRFVLGHSQTSEGILDKAIEDEEKMHGDFLRLNHSERYLELSTKTKTYFTTAVSLWDAEFYVKVDDDVHVNPATLGMYLANHRKKPRIYIGCMVLGPVITIPERKYYEPEYWKFGEKGHNYFLHATGQIYVISNDLASYISKNRDVLHNYVNEDISLGSWLIGLDVEYIHDRRMCCTTLSGRAVSVCEQRSRLGINCAATFDFACSGICESEIRMAVIHKKCKEDENALWSAAFANATSTVSSI